MNFLVIGLGSMGKRRIRCLQALDVVYIVGYDPREDRRKDVKNNYNIDVVADLSGINLSQFDAFIISTPPDKHTPYVKLAIDNKKPVFVEASVILEEVQEIKKYNNGNIFVAPSCTLRFHPLIKDITSIVKSRCYGKITNFSYHSGQYLPDWHPWENVWDFYVSQRITGGGREIVPFELTWIVDTIGWPDMVKGFFGKTIELGAPIEDTYVLVFKYPDVLGSMVVDVASRYAVRNLIINMEKAQIQWKWDETCFRVYETENNRWITYNQPEFNSAKGYNKNIGEEMYINEIRAFINGIVDRTVYPNSIDDDIRILELLNEVELSDGGF